MSTNNCTHYWSRHAHWLLRLGLASVFLFHGIGKFADLGGFSVMMGLSLFMTTLVAMAEVGGALKNDLLTRMGAAAFVPVMIGAIAMVHWPR